MRKINLQMFAWDPNSIVDYLKSTGQDSSYSARKELAQSMGITNYSGTGAQNTQMLNALKNGASKKEETKVEAAPVVQGKPRVEKEEKEPVRTYTPSTATINASNKAQNKLKELDKFNVEDIVSKETWDALNTPFQSSTAYQDAMNTVNSLREQLTSGKTSYTDQIKALLDEIQNRDKFSYDLSNDTLFQQSLASAMASGKTAMQDTMGQASALTGGYGSTYATSAANQTYNQFIEDAYNNLPEYYQMALQAYEMEGNEMYMELSALSDADMAEYEKMYNAYQANFQNAQSIYQNEYTAWQDKVGNALNSAKLQLEEHGTLFDQAYKTYSAYQQNADSLYEKEFSAWQAGADLDFKYESLAQDDRHHSAEMDYKYDALAQNDAQHKAEMGYKYDALAQDDAQFNKTLAQKNASGSGSGGSNSKNSLPSETQMKNALKSYEESGDAGLEKYLASLGKDAEADEVFLTELIDYAHSYGTYTEPEIALEKRTFTKTSDTINWLWGDDNNDKVVDQYGNEYRIDELPESLRSALTKLKKGESYTAK